MDRRRPLRCVMGLSSCCWLLMVLRLSAAEPTAVRVTVVVILASETSTTVDPKVECIAREVQKLEAKLTGFKLARTTSKVISVTSKGVFPLVDNETVTVTVEHGPDMHRRVGLKVKPTSLGEITYDTACGKCFPIVTRYETAGKERLIIAILVRPSGQ